MKYTIYNPNNGRIVQMVVVTDIDQLTATLNGNQYLEGHWADDKYYISNGEPVVKPADPSTTTLQYDWDADNKTWNLNTLFSTIKSREHRNTLLGAVDRINPVWYATLTSTQQQELAQYRQALLDVPQQSGFPEAAIWPTKPQWL